MVVDDHRMLAEALAAGLQTRGFRTRVAGLASAEEVADQARALGPTLVLLDLELGPVDGLRLVPRLHALGIRILVVSACRDQSRLAAAVTLGAVGWVSKARPFEELLEAAQAAAENRALVTSGQWDELARVGRRHLDAEVDLESRLSLLTQREREVLVMIARGMTAQDIAGHDVVSVGTIRTHIRAILMKLGVSSQVAAVALLQQLACTRRGVGPDGLWTSLGSEWCIETPSAPTGDGASAIRSA